MPNRYVFQGVEKIGKTSFAAFTPKPIFLETRGETGLETLIDSGRLQPTPHLPECQTWSDVMGAVEMLREEEHDFRTLVVDTGNGAERLCHEEVCRRDFNNDFGERGFTGYMRGYEIALADWRMFLSALDALRAERKMSIVLLCHTRVKTFKNPEGADYDRYAPDMHEKTWGLTHKWADMVGFMNFEIVVNEADPKKKGKARGGQARILYTERHAAYDAGNRFGLPAEIELGDTPQQAFANFMAALKTAKEGNGNA